MRNAIIITLPFEKFKNFFQLIYYQFRLINVSLKNAINSQRRIQTQNDSAQPLWPPEKISQKTVQE